MRRKSYFLILNINNFSPVPRHIEQHVLDSVLQKNSPDSDLPTFFPYKLCYKKKKPHTNQNARFPSQDIASYTQNRNDLVRLFFYEEKVKKT